MYEASGWMDGGVVVVVVVETSRGGVGGFRNLPGKWGVMILDGGKGG